MKKILDCLVLLALSSPVFSQEPATANCQWLRDYFVSVSNFPKPGFNFITYMELLKDPDAFSRAIQTFAERYRDQNLNAIVGLDARGFIFGAALAYELKVPFVMVRKAGKLARETTRIDYSLEYGTASFEIEIDSLEPGDRVVVIDDVLVTGGTAEAASKLIERLGAEVVEAAFLIEFTFMNGREKLAHPVFSLIILDE